MAVLWIRRQALSGTLQSRSGPCYRVAGVDVGVPAIPVRTYGREPPLAPPPLAPFGPDTYARDFLRGVARVFAETFPIEGGASNRFHLDLRDPRLGDPRMGVDESRRQRQTYAAPLRAIGALTDVTTGEVREQRLFIADVPLMTAQASWIINGVEKVVVPQIVRSPGVYFGAAREPVTGRRLPNAVLIPQRGTWARWESSPRGPLLARLDQARSGLAATILLRALDDPAADDAGSDIRVRAMLAGALDHPDYPLIAPTLERDTTSSRREALSVLHRHTRPGSMATDTNVAALLDRLFGPRRYDMGPELGRRRFDESLEAELADARVRLAALGVRPKPQARLRLEDILAVVLRLLRINADPAAPLADIDHLGNRRVRTAAEQAWRTLHSSMPRLERNVLERMLSVADDAAPGPRELVNPGPLASALAEFFASATLSQFMDQINPLAEASHKRRVSAMGPGGLDRKRAGAEARDVHYTHYGRLCPIESPEGANIGLVSNLARYARLDDRGFLIAPYRRVRSVLPPGDPELPGRELAEDRTGVSGATIACTGDFVDDVLAGRIADAGGESVAVRPFASREIVWMDATSEEAAVIAGADVVGEGGTLLPGRRDARRGGRPSEVPVEQITHVDVAPRQLVSVAASLVPFLDHNDANRALMAANMQRQAVPLTRPDAPLIATGAEAAVSRESGQSLLAAEPGEVIAADARAIAVRYASGREERMDLIAHRRSNQGTRMTQRPIVAPGDHVQAGDPLVDSAASDGGLLALGHSLRVAFMSFEGLNFEDAIVLCESLHREDKLTSVHLVAHTADARRTPLGREEFTRDVPGAGEAALGELNERGLVRVGAEVAAHDVLVGKITPRGEPDDSPEQHLLEALFGKSAANVRDASLRAPPGTVGVVVEATLRERSAGDPLPPDVEAQARVVVAIRRMIAPGDKMAGRHGNKGIVSRIVAVEDMPYLADGRPIEALLSPLGVPSRMNVGQLLETHLGWAAAELGMRIVTPVFEGASHTEIQDGLARAWLGARSGALSDDAGASPHGARLDEDALTAWLEDHGEDAEVVLGDGLPGGARRACLRLWLADRGSPPPADADDAALEAAAAEAERRTGEAAPITGKQTVYDGRTGEPYDRSVTVGYMYMVKLNHLVEEKEHARATGPYSLVTQQPLGGKARFGGQRFGEMEVWALEAYGAAHTLREMLTVKSDDVTGRVRAYAAITDGQPLPTPGPPESLHVLLNELRALCLNPELIGKNGLPLTGDEGRTFGLGPLDLTPALGVSISRPERIAPGAEPDAGVPRSPEHEPALRRSASVDVARSPIE